MRTEQDSEPMRVEDTHKKVGIPTQDSTHHAQPDSEPRRSQTRTPSYRDSFPSMLDSLLTNSGHVYTMQDRRISQTNRDSFPRPLNSRDSSWNATWKCNKYRAVSTQSPQRRALAPFARSTQTAVTLPPLRDRGYGPSPPPDTRDIGKTAPLLTNTT